MWEKGALINPNILNNVFLLPLVCGKKWKLSWIFTLTCSLKIEIVDRSRNEKYSQNSVAWSQISHITITIKLCSLKNI